MHRTKNKERAIVLTEQLWTKLLTQHKKCQDLSKIKADHSVRGLLLEYIDAISSILFPDIIAKNFPELTEYMVTVKGYRTIDGILYEIYGNELMLISCPPGKQGTYVIPEGEGISQIGPFAFYSTKISDIVLPTSLRLIEGAAFYGCNNLKDVHIPAEVTYIGGSQNWCNPFVACQSLQSITVDKGNAFCYSTEDGLLYQSSGRLLCCPGGKTGAIQLPETCYAVGEFAFEGANISKVILPKDFDYIGRYAFRNCKQLTAIEIPASEKEFGDHVFYGCSNLKDVYFHVSDFDLNIENGPPFQGCSQDLCIHAKRGGNLARFAKENGFRFCELAE